MFETLIQQIVAHATYGPAMEKAIAEGAVLVLNYHCHQGNDRYCVSICAKEQAALKILISEKVPLNELVHIEGVGESEAEYLPICVAFSNALRDHYGLGDSFELFFDGEPSPA